MRFKSLHETEQEEQQQMSVVAEEIQQAYDLPTYEEGKGNMTVYRSLTVKQRLAWSVYYFLCAQHFQRPLPAYIVISLQTAQRLLDEEGEVPPKVAGVPLTFNPNEIPGMHSILL